MFEKRFFKRRFNVGATGQRGGMRRENAKTLESNARSDEKRRPSAQCEQMRANRARRLKSDLPICYSTTLPIIYPNRGFPPSLAPR